MKKSLVLLVVLVLAALFVFGCARGGNNYGTTGYAAYGQQQLPQQQAYIGGGCAVAGPDLVMPLDVSEPSLAA